MNRKDCSQALPPKRVRGLPWDTLGMTVCPCGFERNYVKKLAGCPAPENGLDAILVDPPLQDIKRVLE